MPDLDGWRDEDHGILMAGEEQIIQAALDALNALARNLRSALRDERLTDAEMASMRGEWETALDEQLLPAIERVYAEAFDWQADSLTAATRRVSPEATSNARAYVKTIRNRLVGVADNVFKDIQRELAQGMEANEDPEQLARRVDRVFKDRGGNNWLGRAGVVAQTETAAAINAGRMQAARKYARDNSIEQKRITKTWITQRDDRVRETHEALHGETQPLSRDFRVGGVRMNAPGDPRGIASETINCRCTLRFTLPSSLRAGGDIMEQTAEVVPWHGVLAPEGVLSGDRRQFEPESLRHRELPLPLLYQDATAEGHDGAVRVGRIDGISRYVGDGEGSPLMRAWGVMDTHDTAIEAARQLSEGMLRGVSVDVDDATFEFRDENGEPLGDISPFEAEQPIMAVTDGRIAAATLVSIPAFEEAFISLGQPPEDWEIMVEAEDDEHLLAEVAAGDETFATVSDKPWSDFTEADYDDDQWYRACVLHKNGDSRAKSDNGLPIREPSGTLNRNAVHAAASRFNQVDAPEEAKSSAKAALRGAYKALGEEPPEVIAAAVAPAFMTAPALVASGVMSDFADPMLAGPTPLTVTEEGRVFGHLATWGTCHLSFDGQCITPPSSGAQYAYFTTGEVLTADGASIPVGQITLGTGHADARLSAGPAVEHYDDTGTAVADVAAGEDGYGIWIAGRVRDGLRPTMVESLRAAALSGDWRRIGGRLELVAALAVNVPGFPIPRVRSAMVAGAQTSLVASAVVRNPREDDLPPGWIQEALTAALREEKAQQRRAARAARIAASIERDRVSRAQQAAALVHG